MNSDVEKQVWHRASDVYRESLAQVLSQALGRYKRVAGFDDSTRLYESIAGGHALMALRHALMLCWPSHTIESSGSYIELRSRLRAYLVDYLLRKIFHDHLCTPDLRDAFFAADLGV